jgi:glucose/arabinose dehydrogenase
MPALVSSRPAAAGAIAIALFLTIAAAAPAAEAGHALQFDGTGTGNVDRVRIRVDDPATSLPGPRLDVGAADFTIELWVKGTLAGNAAPAIACGANANWINGNVVLDRDRYNQDRKFGLSFGNGRAAFGVSGAGTGERTICGTSNVLDGQWHHVAVQRRRGDGWLWLFVDGNLEAQADGPDGDVSYPDNGVPGNFCGGPCVNDPFLVIGAEKHDAGAAYPSFKGYVDELRISTMLRYPASNFPRPVAPFVADSATAALYHFDEGRGDRLFDVMPKATGATDGEIRRATPTGYPLWSTDTPFNGLGAIGASTLRLANHATGYSAPLDVVAAPDATGSLHVVEQAGRVRIVRNGVALATPFLDLGGKTAGGGERGLLGLAFHPDYVRNGRVFVYYTRASDGALVIERYERSAGNPDTVDPASAKVLLVVPHPTYANHNGGKLAFGADGYLYIGTGDGGGSNDPNDNARRTINNLGKMLRIDVDGTTTAPWYTIPPTNPFAGSTCDGTSGACPEIWALGLRNPWRFSFDRLTGDLYIGDVGQGAREEVNLEPVGTPGGRNYGWRTLEGSICTPAFGSPCPPPPGYAAPIVEYDHSVGSSITGGFRYRGERIPALAGAYLYGDFVSQRLWAATTNGLGAWTGQQQLLVAPSGIAGFGEDAQGELYFAGLGSGTLYRIEAADADGDGLPDWWETAYFGNATSASAGTDSDGDGATNLEELRAGTDPRLAASRPIRHVRPRDFDASGAADLLWRNAATGETAMWLMNGITPTSSAKLAAGPTWRVTHAGDLNADGRQDLIWRNDSTGETAAWLMNATGMAASATLLGDAAWKVTHVGDFDGDGRNDLLWRNDATGATSLWLMNGLARGPGATLLVNPAWRVTHVADFSGDGKADLLWRNDATGETAIWLMNGTAYASGSVILANADWRAELAGDLDGDGRADLVWRNASTGEVALWLLNGASFSAGAIVLANAAWQPTHLVDLDGDGRADILWRNGATGATNAWLMNGLALASGAAIAVAGSNVVATGDYDGDGRVDLIWNNPATGVTQLRLMDGLAVAGTATLITSTVWSVQP